ncbi:MAG: SEC59/DGK1/VTE5 family protein [Chlorobium sp.]|nr:SEC59/DGK1/VTE5 family protein [Chlorobium sp.]MCW8814582.1 SEC59/DGK1/VTE5 family protein [Chlorobium sp.]MCW8819178.1 SEC59/DGK1/VTE5 family protein [Ignavibacteriaceae bacterium]
MHHSETVHQQFRFELARKIIHLSSVSIAIIYCFITRELALLLLIPLFSGFLLVDILKNFIPSLARWYHNTFDPMLREHELSKGNPQLNGATFITFSALLLVLFFPKVIAITCFSLVAISDTMAALVGRKFGKHPIGEKSIEGSLAFLLSALIIVSIIPGLDLFAGIITAFVATVVEALSLKINDYKIDDNLTIPLSSALICYLYYLLFLPHQLPLLDTCP